MKRMMRAAMAAAALAVFSGAAAAQGAPWTVPEKVNPFRFVSPADPAFPEGDPYGLIYGFPVFRLWGWSPNGMIAYSIERGVEGRGGVLVEYVIQSLESDDRLWTATYDSLAWDDPEPADGDFSALAFARIKDFWLGKLAYYGIVQSATEFREWPLYASGHVYAATIDLVREKEPDFRDAVASYAVLVSRDGRRGKVIRREPWPRALAVFVCGYFKSPYEDRIAVITAEERFVFEGTELFYEVSGCDLTKGF